MFPLPQTTTLKINMLSSNLITCRVPVAAGCSNFQSQPRHMPINSRPLFRRNPCFRQALRLSTTANKLPSPLLSFHNRLSSSATISKDLNESIRNVNDTGFVMAKHLISGEAKDRNLVFSPLSIHAVLSLLTAGASGATKDKLLSLLKAESPSDLNSLYADLVAPVLADGSQAGGPELSSDNKIWTDKSISLKPRFKQVADTVYKVDTSQVDFQNKADEAVEQINQWVEDKTKGLTKEVLSVEPLIRFICSNAIRFKGVWSEAFNKSHTKDYDFHLLDGSRVKVPFMTNSEDQAVCAYDGFKVLRLPYKRGQEKRRFSMYIILPDAKDGLPSLVEKVCSQQGFLDSHIPKKEVEVGAFWIPKFKLSYEFEASEVLERLGLALPLGAEGGGFVEMVDDPLVYVSSIRHKACIEVDENGTEAMAFTMAEGMLGCAMNGILEPRMRFVADHPFMYVIREDTTGAVLFIGQVHNPQSEHST